MIPREASKAVALRGISSLLGLPIGDLEDLRPGDLALVGLFNDHEDRVGFGARFAARQIRYASRPAYGMAAQAWATMPGRERVFDVGDLNVFPLEPQRQYMALQAQLASMLDVGARVVVVGGAMSLNGVVGAALGVCQAASGLPALRIGGRAQGAPGTDPVPEGTGTTEPVFLEVVLDRLFDPAAGQHAASRLLTTLGSLNLRQVRVAHLTGFAPELDLSARRETALAAHVLEVLVQCLVAGGRDALAA
jgi:hypothetical protein